MKTKIRIISFMLLLISACKKEDDHNSDPQPATTDQYSSLSDFYSKNGVALQTYIIVAETGGNFTTPKGTTVQIPANAFTTETGGSVTGNVTIEFKDLYKKSDMLLSDKPTITSWGTPLKSAGEFFIKALQQNEPLKIAELKKIEVIQPVQDSLPIDTGMEAFVQSPETLGVVPAWQNSWFDAVNVNASQYIFSLYSFSDPVASGTWCNSDNSSYFSAYPPAELTIRELNNAWINLTDVFLIFSSVNSMIHVYRGSSIDDFKYSYAPTGLNCTVVAVCTNGGKLYSSFTPITISNNLDVNFSLTETTTEEFKSHLNSLN